MAFLPFLQGKTLWVKHSLLSAGQSLTRNKFLNVATILIIALMFFVFNLILALNFAAESVIANVGNKLDISVEMREGVENYSIQAFVDQLKKRPEIKEVVYISKEDALSQFGSKYPNIISFLNHHQLKNPLPNVVRIVSRDLSRNNQIIEYLEQTEFSRLVNQEKLQRNVEQKSRNEKVLNITRFIKHTGFWLNLIFAGVALMIIFNSININIHNHRNEITVMKLVGAKYHFIRGGFIFEGVAFALFALLISFAFSRLILGHLAKNLVGVISNENLLAGMNAILLHFEDHFWVTLSWQLLITTGAAALSSYLAIELYLRKQHLF